MSHGDGEPVVRGWIVGVIRAVEHVLRQYLSRRSNLAAIDERELALIEKRLNDRPRRVLGWETPAERFMAARGAR